MAIEEITINEEKKQIQLGSPDVIKGTLAKVNAGELMTVLNNSFDVPMDKWATYTIAFIPLEIKNTAKKRK